jgi:excisionase family DNA binding protein
MYGVLQNRKKEVYMDQNTIPVSEKFLLTIREASEYFNIGIKYMRRLAEEHGDSFAVRNGNRLLIIRRRFEEYILSRLTGGEGGNRI